MEEGRAFSSAGDVGDQGCSSVRPKRELGNVGNQQLGDGGDMGDLEDMDEGTASASERLAADLRERGAPPIVIQRTFQNPGTPGLLQLPRILALLR